MEDDDEFGDLYTDVLQPFSSSLSSAPPPEPPQPTSLRRPIDLNNDGKDDDEILSGASHRNPPVPSNPDSARNSIPVNSNSAAAARVLSSPEPSKPLTAGDSAGFQSGGDGDKDVKFDIEEEDNTEIIGDSSVPVIPGLTIKEEDSGRNEAGGGRGVDEDWEDDSDSEDDLQIVLNDNNRGPMGMERGRIMGDADEDDDEDEDELVIVANGDPNQAIEEQDWAVGEEGAAATVTSAEGERKEGGEATSKGNSAAVPKIGYSNHGYHHPFHSQFKVSVVVVAVMC